MNMEEIKHKYNLVAMIAAIGAAIAFVGVIITYVKFDGRTGFLDLIVFILLVACAIQNIRPNTSKMTVALNLVVGILAAVNAGFDYMNIADYVDAKTFMDVGIGIWMTFAGLVIYMIFTISDLIFKRSE